jgi:23S rRNA (cytidine1920-2'-O)/16S rRNA (cytidine1409-2'-O)-methyltransferase
VRVRAIERANALFTVADDRVDLVVMDLGWTPQRLALPAAAKWLNDTGRIISLIKPHYESGDHMMSEADAERIVHETIQAVAALGFTCNGLTKSPIAGSRRKGKSAKSGTGNAEWLGRFEFAQADDAAQPG